MLQLWLITRTQSNGNIKLKSPIIDCQKIKYCKSTYRAHIISLRLIVYGRPVASLSSLCTPRYNNIFVLILNISSGKENICKTETLKWSPTRDWVSVQHCCCWPKWGFNLLIAFLKLNNILLALKFWIIEEVIKQSTPRYFQNTLARMIPTMESRYL